MRELLNYLQSTFGSRQPLPDFSRADLEDYLRQTNCFSVPAVERLRQLAIFLERECSTGDPFQDWAVLRQVYDFGATIISTDDALWWSRGITATHLAEIESDPKLADELFAEGEACCRKALELAPCNPGILYSLGINAYMNPHRTVSEAKQHFAAVLKCDPSHIMAQLYLGHCCQDEGAWREALDAYSHVDQQQLARDWPHWRTIKLQEQIALCYMKCGLRQEAVWRFQEVLSVYEAIEPDQVLELAFPDELVEAATGELRADLYNRTKACVEKNGQGRLYARQFGPASSD
jgi:tetratricopeptide (TPR) repeat protein